MIMPDKFNSNVTNMMGVGRHELLSMKRCTQLKEPNAMGVPAEGLNLEVGFHFKVCSDCIHELCNLMRLELQLCYCNGVLLMAPSHRVREVGIDALQPFFPTILDLQALRDEPRRVDGKVCHARDAVIASGDLLYPPLCSNLSEVGLSRGLLDPGSLDWKEKGQEKGALFLALLKARSLPRPHWCWREYR